jgi:Carboxypeptidase regulatory-like domain
MMGFAALYYELQRIGKLAMRSIQLLLLVVVLLAPLDVVAQQTGDLGGRVADVDGAALPGATVTLTGAGGRAVQMTNGNGQYRFQGLSPGSYRLGAHVEGFSDVTLPEPVAIEAGQNAIDFHMRPER